MNSRCADDAAMAQIKAATRRQHEALEARAGILERVQTPAGYAVLIATFAKLHDVYEPQIGRYADRFGDFGLSLEQRSKRALLEEDRIRIWDRFAIGVPPASTDASSLPGVETFAAAVGWLYVFEGSTLGGMMIAQHARRALGIVTAYYGAYGAQTANMWREFREFVCAYVAGECDALPAIITGAQTAFAVMEEALTNADARLRCLGHGASHRIDGA